VAVDNGHEAVARLLAEKGADVAAQTYDGWTALRSTGTAAKATGEKSWMEGDFQEAMTQRRGPNSKKLCYNNHG
jgi:Ankyrin repeats (many copies)